MKDFRGRAIEDTSPLNVLRLRPDQSGEPVNRELLDTGARATKPEQRQGETREAYLRRRDAESSGINDYLMRGVSSQQYGGGPSERRAALERLQGVGREAAGGKPPLLTMTPQNNADMAVLRARTLTTLPDELAAFEQQADMKLTDEQRKAATEAVGRLFAQASLTSRREEINSAPEALQLAEQLKTLAGRKALVLQAILLTVTGESIEP